MKSKLLPFFCVLLLACSFKSGDNPDQFDYGHVEKNTYINSFFKMHINLPDSWSLLSKEQMNQFMKSGEKLVTNGDKNMEAVLKASEIKTANLVSAFQYPLGSPVNANSNLMINAVNIQTLPGMKTGSDFLFQARKVLQHTALHYDVLDSVFTKENIGGKEFYFMNTEMNIMGIDVKQRYYSTVLNGFTFNIIITYSTPEQEEVLMKSVRSMKFK
jgi:hypothetical protein